MAMGEDGVERVQLVIAVGVAVLALAAAFTLGAGADVVTVRDPAAELAAARAAAAATTTTLAPVPGCDAIADLTLRQRLARLVMVGVNGSSATEVPDLLARPERPVGVFVGGKDDAVFTTLPGQATTHRVVIAADEEGGRVQRIDRLDGSIPSARVQAQTLDAGGIRRLGAERGKQLQARGITMDLAPVVDVTTQADGDVIGDRSYGADAAAVTRAAGAFADGLRSAGILPTLKHFPGHGRGAGDSHVQAVTTPPLAELEKVELVPYRSLLREAPVAVLVGHLTVPGLTEAGLPASLSPATYRYLRTTMAFDGLAVTDDLANMKAVTGTFAVDEAVERAIEAGADLALVDGVANLGPVIARLEAAHTAGRLTDQRFVEAVQRSSRAAGCPS